ncbi:Oligosaccharide biosynthesis protein Alg14 like protein [Sphingobium chlorophenolicum]|uniref:Oligosaccharide biosynthesis protein Alg14 like protein n=2 Tax=Sphingobium chlorophenolicum TaxID=46429 RepID=A0A081RB72_SPHCR|nr:Oligosaccharide biosynthesis protein Alg14 like protein [Sphingobium chlorophenolicum]
MVRVLAVSSGGGHWEELMLLKDAFDNKAVHFATTFADLPTRAGITEATILPDCNRSSKWAAISCIWKAFNLVRLLRPDVVISTGAAPGFFCIVAGKLFGAKTLWIESFANAESLSMCGKLAARIADRTIVQWEHLARPQGPHFAGALL